MIEFLNKDNPEALREYEAFNMSHPKGHFCQSVI